MFVAVFAVALATAYAAEIPSYINVCGRKDPNLNKCVADNLQNLQDKICKGLTEMNLPPIEPFIIDRLVLSETGNNKVYLNDIQITGICNYIVKSVDINMDKLNFNMEVFFNRLYLNGTYDIDIRILVPIVHKAPIYLAIASYINVCGRRDPNLNQCIINNVNNLKSKICEGIPELDIPSNDPVVIDELVISDTANTKIYLRDIKVGGLCDFIIKFFHFDLNTLHFNGNISFGLIRANATYDFDVRILVPIAHKGQVYITTDKIDAQVDIDLKVITKAGKKYMYLSKMKLNIDIHGYNAKYDVNERDIGQLTEIINNFIGNNQEEVIKSFKPVLEEVISKRILMVANDIVKHFTYEELFPDRT
ncbi:putative beta-carotene-binding protein [Polyergus mexicanus]|uniref:putative beta-carotene-binding protein n=1 Tax=Polyergus mexicanus TaxID=615972 RepID=UPI0038B69364